MKKFLTVLLIILIIAAIIGGCVFAYFYFTKEEVNDKKDNEIIKEESAIFFTEGEFPKIDASTATHPLAVAFKTAFTGEEASKDEMNLSSTHSAYVRLINGERDLILVTEPSEEELTLAKDKGIELEVIPVVKEGFVFYVNEKNKVESLKLEEIQKIYSGEITNWKQVGGSDNLIQAYQRPVNSGSQTGMLSLVMKGKQLAEPKKEEVAESMTDIINLVSSYDNGENSIGYSYYYYATEMYNVNNDDRPGGIKLLGINGVKPSVETIRDESYPINTSYYIVINKAEPKDGNVRKLIKAMLSTKGQQVAEEAGYVKLK